MYYIINQLRSKFLAIETTYLSNSYDDNAAEDTEACMSSFYNDMDDLITSVNQVGFIVKVEII